jgi:hypothetical protein
MDSTSGAATIAILMPKIGNKANVNARRPGWSVEPRIVVVVKYASLEIMFLSNNNLLPVQLFLPSNI